ncbi:MAG: hypothetical protein V7607_2524 [Solirubrobacteraceae bacterium]
MRVAELPIAQARLEEPAERPSGAVQPHWDIRPRQSSWQNGAPSPTPTAKLVISEHGAAGQAPTRGVPAPEGAARPRHHDISAPAGFRPDRSRTGHDAAAIGPRVRDVAARAGRVRAAVPTSRHIPATGLPATTYERSATRSAVCRKVAAGRCRPLLSGQDVRVRKAGPIGRTSAGCRVVATMLARLRTDREIRFSDQNVISRVGGARAPPRPR